MHKMVRKATAFGLVLVFSVIMTSTLWSLTGNNTVQFKTLKEKDGKITLSAAGFKNQKAKFYSVLINEVNVRFFVVQSADGINHASFDACTVCYQAKKGYKQIGDKMSCNNCGNQYETKLLELDRRGCNPVHIPLTTDKGSLSISLDDLKKGAVYFN